MLAALAALVAIPGCGESPSETMGHGPNAFDAVVSEPVPAPQPALRVGDGDSAARDSVAYVSLPPGAVPAGRLVTVRNRATGDVRTAPVVEGGFDPIAVPAGVGDTLEITLQDGSANDVTAIMVVAPRRPPVVVRTDPPPRKIDVPLNAVIIVVFSEPIDPGSVTSATIMLSRGAAPVGAALGLSGDGLRAELRPDAPLEPETEYRLAVTTDVTDLAGDRLEEPVALTFTTRPRLPVASVSVSPDTAAIDFGSSVPMTAVARDSAGNVLSGALVIWSSSNPAIAAVSGAGVVTSAGPGSAVITASAEGVAGSAAVSVRALALSAVSAGGRHTCGLTVGGSAVCWGANSQGQLGRGGSDTAHGPTPRTVVGGLVFLALAAGDQHTCGRTPTVFCWGSDSGWALGQRTFVHWSPLPLPIVDTGSTIDTRPWSALDAGTQRSCALSGTEDRCWGRYQLQENEFFYFEGAVPWDVGFRFDSLASGGNHDCGLTTAGLAYCWGVNAVGQRGDGTVGYLDPFKAQRVTAVAGTLTFASLSAGETHTCGLTPLGSAWCWGDNASGQLGTDEVVTCGGSPGDCSPAPVPVRGGLPFVTISAGGQHTCGIATGGAAYCWGDNRFGQLGGTIRTQGLMVVDGGLSFASLSAGHLHTCGVTTEGLAYCWGDNSHGQLGDGTTVNRRAPVLIAGQR